MICYKVPATSANIGAGFDCFGMALGLYNKVSMELCEKLDIRADGKMSQTIPLDKTNLAYKSAEYFFKKTGFEFKSLKIRIKNEIPISRGLGSSSSVIIGSLLCANEISGKNLSNDQILKMANEIEGHPDNVAPALFGGFTIATVLDDELLYRKIEIAPDLKAVVFIPSYQISTKDAREILPKNYKREDAVYNISAASLTLYSILNRDYSLLSKVVKDKIHQPYRKKLIKEYDDISTLSKKYGAITTFISGSGSTMLSLVKDENSVYLEKNMKKELEKTKSNIQIKLLDFINTGAVKSGMQNEEE